LTKEHFSSLKDYAREKEREGAHRELVPAEVRPDPAPPTAAAGQRRTRGDVLTAAVRDAPAVRLSRAAVVRARARGGGGGRGRERDGWSQLGVGSRVEPVVHVCVRAAKREADALSPSNPRERSRATTRFGRPERGGKARDRLALASPKEAPASALAAKTFV